MVRLMAACLVLITMCLPDSVGAVGKSTLDPNAAGISAVAQMITDADAGTSQRVTYEAKRKTVTSILADLNAMTGVTLKAGYNNEDWQVRDRRMNIFAKDIPLSNLMNSIARVMKFQWSKREDDKGVVSYRLYMDRKTILGAESKRLAEEERVRKGLLEGRNRFLSAMEAAAIMSNEDLEKLKTQSPSVYKMVDTSMRFLPQILAELPLAKQAFLSGVEFTLDIGALSPEVRQGLIGAIGINDPTSGTVWIGGLGVPSYTNMSVYRSGSSAPHVSPYIVTGMGAMRFELKNSHRSCEGASAFIDPESDLTRLQTKYMDAVLHDDDYEELAVEMTKAGKALVVDMGEPLAIHSDDPDLSAKVKMKVDGNDFANVLAALADSSSFAVVSDSFNKSFWDLAFREDEITIRAALARMESVCRYNWARHNSILEFNDRDWYRKRAAQIPEVWLEAWRKAFKNNGMLDLDELSQIASLTPEQAGANLYDDDVLRQAHVGLFGDREFLRLYAVLDKQQKTSIFTERGLYLDSLSDNGSTTVQALLKRCASVKGSSDGGLRLIGKRAKVGESTHYDLSVITSAGDNTGIRWTVQCPIYTPPIEEKPKDGKTLEAPEQHRAAANTL